jgi:hypothetical protein
MFMEDFLVYSHYLHGDLSELPYLRASENISVPNQEVTYLEGIDIEGIAKFLLVHRTDELIIREDKKDFAAQKLDWINSTAYEKIKTILKFYNTYYRVYIKYKHGFSAIIGTYSIVRNSYSDRPDEIKSHIIIRDRRLFCFVRSNYQLLLLLCFYY